MDFGLAEHQEQLVRIAEQWIERSWRAGDIESVAGRKKLWGEVVANGWADMVDPSFETASPLDAALLVEALARGGCSLPLATGAMMATFVAAATGLDASPGNEAVLSFESSDRPRPFGRGLELADRVLALRWSGATEPGSRRSWRLAELPVSHETGRVTVVQEEARVLLATPADDAWADAAWHEVDGDAMELTWQIGAVLSAAELVGLASAVLDMCVEYAEVREQGGKPIGGHQAIQHRLADMLGFVDRARYATYAAALGVTSGSPGVVHQAKALAARDCLGVMRAGHQVIGAISYSDEHELPHLHKQATIAAHEHGSSSWHWQALEHLAASR